MIKTLDYPRLGSNMRYWPQSAPSHVRFYLPFPFSGPGPLVGHIYFRDRRDLVEIDSDRLENAIDEAKTLVDILGTRFWGRLWDHVRDSNRCSTVQAKITLPDNCGYVVGNYKRSDGSRLPRIVVIFAAKENEELVTSCHYLDADAGRDIDDVRGFYQSWMVGKEPVSWEDVKKEALTQVLKARIQGLLDHRDICFNPEWVFTGREASHITALFNELVLTPDGEADYTIIEELIPWLIDKECNLTYTKKGNQRIGWLETPKGKISFGYRG